MKKILLITLLALLLGGCGPKVLNADDYIAYLRSENSDLTKHALLNGVDYCLTYLPPEYLLLVGNGGKVPATGAPEALDEQRRQLNFTLLIQDENREVYRVKSLVNTGEFTSVLHYANTEMKQDFKLLSGGDTLYCNILHVEPANSLQPLIRVSLVFNAPSNTPLKEGFTLLYTDRIFNNGPVKYNYSNRVMAALPQLKLKP